MIVVKRAWMPLAIAVLVAIAGFAVYRLHGIFGVHPTTSAASARADDIKPFNPKRVTLEVFGAAGAVADINYLDVNAAPQRVDGAGLPWTYSVSTTAPAVSVNVVAQGDGEVIGCRITVNGGIRDQRTVEGIHPQTFCLVKSA
ncbi:MmpS family protein [Mycobacterium sp. 852002-51057_SCH5723018]|uniref:MmpS family protein n=1 Tax=Mycobacterium sp. 852002-51057_SCH5723018 TaxID=1834094 RepID=UPI000A9071F7|nr:MmpS family protein [Mycobacterium sp. 852002-51057_SCH5723018]